MSRGRLRTSPWQTPRLWLYFSYVGEISLARQCGTPNESILDVSVAVNAIRAAFQPLACIVEIYSNDSRLRFRVLGRDNKPILKVVGISLRDAVDPIRLRAEIEEARVQLERQGFALEAWTPP